MDETTAIKVLKEVSENGIFSRREAAKWALRELAACRLVADAANALPFHVHTDGSIRVELKDLKPLRQALMAAGYTKSSVHRGHGHDD